MYSCRPPHMAVQKQDSQHEHTFNNYVRIRDVALKTCLRRCTIGKSGERGSGISVLPARHDDDDDDLIAREVLGLDSNTWNHITVQIICIRFEYLQLYKFE